MTRHQTRSCRHPRKMSADIDLRFVPLPFFLSFVMPEGRLLAPIFSLPSSLIKKVPGLVPADEVLFFREKDPKPLIPRLAPFDEVNAAFRRADQLAGLKQGPPFHSSVHFWGQPPGIRIGK